MAQGQHQWHGQFSGGTVVFNMPHEKVYRLSFSVPACHAGTMASKGEESQERKTVVTAQGRVTLPAGVRKQADLQPGTTLYIHVDDDGAVRLETWEQRANRLRRSIAAQLTGVGSLAQELGQDRRAEAEREEAA